MSIPPLLCSTPPPLSDSDDKDDDEFPQFDESSLPATPLHKTKNKEDTPDLPVPSDMEFQIYSTTANVPPAPPDSKTESTYVLANGKNTIQVCGETPTEMFEEVTAVNHSPKSPMHTLSQGPTADAEVNEGVKKLPTDDQMCILAEDDDLTKSPKSQNPSGKSSPQSLELSTGNLSIDDDEGDIDDASIVDFQVAEQKYDDNTSLPSFDSISVSKSTTPIPGNDKPPPHESPTDEFKNLSDKSISSAFQSPDDEVATNDDDVTKSEPPEERVMGLVAQSCEPMGANEHEANEFAKVTISELIPNCPQTKAEDFRLDPDEQNKNFQILDPTEDSFAAPIPQELSAGTISEATESFDADFSQFEAFNEPHPNQDDLQLKSQTVLNETFHKNTITELGNKQNDKGEEVDDDFEDFQDFASSNENAVVEDDDDFGDFNDFKDASPLDSNISSFTQTAFKFSSIDERLKPVLEMMFPIENEDTTTAADQQSISQDFKNNVIGNLKDLESAKALDYQWSSSSIKHSLITALGIDSRNILYGEKWNSSMPRFAANLGFNPLEPLKPTPLTSSSGSSCGQSSNTQRSSVKPTSGNEVPAVQFDWNTSGLVNPLDGIKEILHERKIEEVHTSRLGDIDQLDDIQQTEEMTIANEEKDSAGSNLSAKDSDTYLPGTNNDLISDYHLKRDHIDNLRHAPTTFIVPLKETHIFTPDKSENTISRCVKSTDNKCPIDFDYEMAAAGIIIDEQVVKKEYRDIEYNPDKFSMDDVSNVDDYLPYVTKHPARVEGILDMKHDGGNVANDWHLKDFNAKDALAGSLESFSEFQTAPVNFLTTADMEKELETKTERNRILKSSTLDDLPKQLSAEHDPTTIMDDEFCEFQSVPPISGLTAGKENRIRSNLEDKPRSRTGTPTEMILSPAVLLPQSIQIEPSPQINWPEPGIDPDELARLEQLFPQPKNNQQSHSVTANADKKSTDHSRITKNASNQPASRDDEDWSDFISVPAVSTVSVKPTNSASSTKPNKTICSDDDDWSDFVSSAPPQLPSNNFQSWNLTQMPPPNFNSWHQPNAYGSNVGHILNATTNVAAPTTLFCQHHNNNNNINHSTSKTMLQQNIFNGYSSTGMMQSHVNSHHQPIQYQQQQHSVFSMGGQQNNFAQHQMQQQPQRNQAVLKSQLNKAPSIALIPDLGFVSPRTFINVPKTTYNKK